MSLHDAIDRDALDRFWRFVAERQRIWVRRVVRGEPPPWTDDALLRGRRFTNVYRLLDPGTQYAIQAILSRDAPASDRAFNLLLYRLVGRLETHEKVGFQSVRDVDAAAVERLLQAVASGADHPVFTGAYVVPPLATRDGADKIENVARCVGEIADGFERFLVDLRAADDPAAAFRVIRSLPGFGDFLAYQVLVDLRYPLPDRGGDAFLEFDGGSSIDRHAETSPVPGAGPWAKAGPGARRGIDRLYAGRGDPPDDLATMRWLHREQVAAFDRRGIDVPWLRDADAQRIELSIADVQNCCCEFAKYEAMRRNEGRSQRRFDVEDCRSAAALRRMYEGYPISVAPSDYP